MKKTIILVTMMMLVVGCGEPPGIRHYTEIVIESESADPHAGLDMRASRPSMQQRAQDPAVQEMLAASRVEAPIRWQTPSGWIEKAGGTMRLATFTSNENDPITCTIVSLGGMAGGLEGNIQRWLGQINISVSASEFNEFVNSADTIETRSGLPVQLIDFTQLQVDASAQANSMMAAVLNLDAATVFVKMTGTLQSVDANRKKFLALVRSIEVRDE